mmetsp:Transcript_12324/g.30191  ORF Transcript_12324/g.30191 Transcript_12324/m.30191 type:complete len:213 (+) Transcript_12324:1744-2382(+)
MYTKSSARSTHTVANAAPRTGDKVKEGPVRPCTRRFRFGPRPVPCAPPPPHRHSSGHPRNLHGASPSLYSSFDTPSFFSMSSQSTLVSLLSNPLYRTSRRKSLGKSLRRLSQIASRPLLPMLFQYRLIFFSRLLLVITCAISRAPSGPILLFIRLSSSREGSSLPFSGVSAAARAFAPVSWMWLLARMRRLSVRLPLMASASFSISSSPSPL